jgi:hypothetical protein
MAQRVTGDVAAAAVDVVVRPIALAFLDFQSGAVYANSTGFPIFWDGQEWDGVGQLGAIGPIEESIESKSTGLALTLSGVDAENLAKAIGDRYQGRTGRVYIALLDNAYEIIGEPVLSFEGPMDSMPVKVAGETISITVNITDGRADWEQPRTVRYTNEDQQARYPGDKGFEFVPQMVEKNIIWGQ